MWDWHRVFWRCFNPFGKYRICSGETEDGSIIVGALTEEAWQRWKEEAMKSDSPVADNQ